MARDYSRRWFVSRLGLLRWALPCALPLTALARPVRPRRIGLIAFLSPGLSPLVAAFEDEMRRLGYVEGKNVVIERRLSRPNSPDLAEQAAELVHRGTTVCFRRSDCRPEHPRVRTQASGRE